MKHNKQLYLLIASSIVMLISIFSFSYRILGIGLLQWVVVVFFSFAPLWRGRLAYMTEYNFQVAKESAKQKKYGKAITYILVMPMMVVGVATIGIMITIAIVLGGT